MLFDVVKSYELDVCHIMPYLILYDVIVIKIVFSCVHVIVLYVLICLYYLVIFYNIILFYYSIILLLHYIIILLLFYCTNHN